MIQCFLIIVIDLDHVNRDSEDNWRTHIKFLHPNISITFAKCPATQNIKQKITFTIQRDDSTSTSVIKYRMEDNGKY